MYSYRYITVSESVKEPEIVTLRAPFLRITLSGGGREFTFNSVPAFHYSKGSSGGILIDAAEGKQDYDIPPLVKILADPWGWGSY